MGRILSILSQKLGRNMIFCRNVGTELNNWDKTINYIPSPTCDERCNSVPKKLRQQVLRRKYFVQNSVPDFNWDGNLHYCATEISVSNQCFSCSVCGKNKIKNLAHFFKKKPRAPIYMAKINGM